MKPLRMDNEEYHALIEQLPDIIYKIDTDGYFVFLNDSIAMLGYKPEELLGKHYSTIVDKDYIDKISRDKVLPEYKDKITGDQDSPKLFDERRKGKRGTINLEIQLVHKQKKNRKGFQDTFYTIVNSEGLWITDEQGKKKFIGTIGIIRDITGIRTREEKVLCLNILLKAMKKVHYLFNRENDFIKIGQSICEILLDTKLYIDIHFAYQQEKSNRIVPLENFNHSFKMKWAISPEGNGNAPPCIHEILRSELNITNIRQGNFCKNCGYCRHEAVHNTIVLKISYQNRIIGILLICIDNTRPIHEEETALLEEIAEGFSFAYGKFKSDLLLKGSEAQYRHLIENINEGIWVIDKIYNTTFINSKMAEMLIYEKEELIGKSILEYVHVKDKRNFWIYLKQCIMGIKKQYDCRFNCKIGGRTVYVLIAASSLVDENGIYTGLILGVVDITRRKQIEKSLIKKNRMLNRFNNIAVQREIKMIELKKEINSLLTGLNKEPRYKL
ncbi:MAG: PAS domain S-box protein [Spirochaetales bacterium]|nr:PAS domain S-box protein [Spirochaetales bacterium]